jgi:hypothetical protein
VLAARGVLSDEHPLVGASKLVSGIATFAAVPLFLAWVVLVVVQRRR